MVRVYDNWERLVRATLLREELRQIAHEQSTSSISSFSSSISRSNSSLFDVDFENSIRGVLFTYQQICQATNDFGDKNLIKHGHSGDLFRGILDDGIQVVVKRIDLRSVKSEWYVSELEFFSKISHQRFVNLLGHCLTNEAKKFLVYRYFPNGDLSNSLFKKNIPDDDHFSLVSLDWITRLKIATEAAEGLAYLHDECSPPIVHRNVEASSILLDEKFEVKLGSLSEICLQRGGTRLKMITRLLRLPQTSKQRSSDVPNATCAYDVYCFGKVLLELVTGRLGIDRLDTVNLKKWLAETLPYISINNRNLVTKIMDPSLFVDEDHLEEVWAVAIVAKACLNPKPSKRPLMRSVLKSLENPLAVVRDNDRTREALTKTQEIGSMSLDKAAGITKDDRNTIVTKPNGVTERWDHKKVLDSNIYSINNTANGVKSYACQKLTIEISLLILYTHHWSEVTIDGIHSIVLLVANFFHLISTTDRKEGKPQALSRVSDSGGNVPGPSWLGPKRHDSACLIQKNGTRLAHWARGPHE
ncbi:putative LRR receptor-like serine/threonine-protein kinase [Forsythia ovata]|uniref:LRR receptor-like serine/threonine-protein kinase n=1 Tax=Forsythia ovata TaxID=205694 RepID=A0ABD1QLP6_9LAMI